MDLSKVSDVDLEREVRERKYKRIEEDKKKHLAKPYRPGKKEVRAEKLVPCFPTCREQDIFSTAYGADCMVCGQDWT